MENEVPLLQIKNLTVSYLLDNQEKVKAVRNFSLMVMNGEILGLMGPSGCGKTTLALTLLQLQRPAYIEGGEIVYKGRDLLKCSWKEKKKLLGKEIAFIFQDPTTSLNPVLSVGRQIGDVLQRHGKKSAVGKGVQQLLEQVELDCRLEKAYPHQLSGGMKQRIMIALALAASPSLLIADEPTSSLDIVTKKQILQLLLKIKEQEQLTILLITHDRRVAAKVCDRVAMMEQGKLIEILAKKDFLDSYQYPFRRQS